VAPDAGNYVVAHALTIDTNQCALTRMISIITHCSAGIGISEIGENIDLNIYPNPATDRLHVSYELEKPSSIAISIFDLTGREVYHNVSKQLRKKDVEDIGLQTFDVGYYLIRVSAGASFYIGKFMKE
jgi:hypothetical protein